MSLPLFPGACRCSPDPVAPFSPDMKKGRSSVRARVFSKVPDGSGGEFAVKGFAAVGGFCGRPGESDGYR